MPQIVHLPLSVQDFFRLHPAMDTEPRHWLLDSVYGRQLLKARLHRERPDLQVSLVREQRELDPKLAVQIELLGLDEWPRPCGIAARFRAFQTQCAMLRDILEERPMRSWRTGGEAASQSDGRGPEGSVATSSGAAVDAARCVHR